MILIDNQYKRDSWYLLHVFVHNVLLCLLTLTLFEINCYYYVITILY